MPTKPQDPPKHVTFYVSTKQRSDVEHPLAAYVFDARGELVERAHVGDERSDNRAVCNAWVHICEVDRVARLISKLPDPDVLRLRDDLLDIIRNAPIPRPIPDPDPEPFPPGSGPRPESAAFRARYYGSPRIWARSLASTCSLPRLTGVSVSIRSRSRRCRAASFQQ
jgi:hypothetical protein